MKFTSYSPRSRSDPRPPTTAAELSALLAVCALVAYADGKLSPQERQGFISRVRGLAAVSAYGVEEAMVAFESVIETFVRDPRLAVAKAEAAIVGVKDQPSYGAWLVRTAWAVADADGAHDEEERRVIERLCALLDVDPTSFETERRD